MDSYTNPIKNEAREKLIKHAIQSLTVCRYESFLVSKDHLTKITDHFNSLFFRFMLKYNDFDFNQYKWLFEGGRNSWFDFYDGICKTKTSGELKVLYLSGPEPYNDIDILCSNGIRLENIWAIESDKKIYEQAVKSLTDANIQIKIHRGSLEEFFELTNHEFDIIYFDACSPVFSQQHSPVEILKQIFLNKRLTGLSALITNFAEPGNNYNWGDIFATWFTSNSEVPKEDYGFGKTALEKSTMFPEYSQYISQHLNTYYDTFLTHFIPALGSEIIPMWQLSSLGSVQNNHLLNNHLLQKELNLIREHKANGKSLRMLINTTQHYLFAIDGYPLLNWTRLIKEKLAKSHTLNRFIDSNRNGMTIEDSMFIGDLLKCFEEAESGFKTFIYDICGEKLKKTLIKLDFFDREMRLTCDIPMKNLFVELLIGLYGYPYIAHAEKTLSLKYKAKETTMYSNVFIFDQCRYLYDFMPTLDLWENFFENLPNQVIIRGCIDGIRRNHLQLNSSLFKWGFIEGIHGEFSQANLSERINLNETNGGISI